MSEIYLDNLAGFHAKWTEQRQAVLAGNIANANTVGFKATDIVPFDQVLSKADLSQSKPFRQVSDSHWDILHSGTAVNLANEMIKQGETVHAMELNTSVMRSFHRMVLQVFGN